MDSPDDLLVKRRRGALPAADEQRLRAVLRASREYELAQRAGDVFERDGASLPGDAELSRRLVSSTEGRWFGRGRRFRVRRPVRLWVALPLAFAGAAAASYGSYRALTERHVDVPAQVSPATAARRVAPMASTVPEATPDVGTAELAVEEPTSGEPASVDRTMAPSPARSRVVMRPEPPPAAAQRPARPPKVELREEPPASNVSAVATLPGEPVDRAAEVEPARPEPAPPEPELESARSLFRRGQALRQSDRAAAADVYRSLIERYPTSTEASVAELALGKWAFAEGRHAEAVSWFRAHRRRGGALEAEALWGEARALESLDETRVAGSLWRLLLKLYPDSPYAAVARERLRD